MTNEFQGRTLEQAMEQATAIHRKRYSLKLRHAESHLDTKRNTTVLAPPLSWGPWVEIYRYHTPKAKTGRVTVRYQSITPTLSSFDVEIEGAGGQRFREVGRGRTVIKLPENSIGALKLRAKSHSITQNIRVHVDGP